MMPGLQEILGGLDVIEFVRQLEREAAPDPADWADARDDLILAEVNWIKSRAGGRANDGRRLQICARQYACVAYDGAWWAVVRLHYRIHEVRTPVANPPEHGGDRGALRQSAIAAQ